METLLFNEDFDNNLIDNNDDEYRRDDDMWALSRLPEKCFGAMSRRRRFEMHGYDYIERSVTLMCFLCVAGGVWVAVGGPSPVRRGPRYCPADPPTHPRFPFLSSIVSECAVCVSVSIVVASPIFSPSCANLDAICLRRFLRNFFKVYYSRTLFPSNRPYFLFF